MNERRPVDTCSPRPIEAPDPAAAARAETLARYARALGHPARVAIVQQLLRLDACFAGAIADELPLAASTVSQHLRQLKDSGLIQGEVDGPRVCYCVNKAALAELKALVESL